VVFFWSGWMIDQDFIDEDDTLRQVSMT